MPRRITLAALVALAALFAAHAASAAQPKPPAPKTPIDAEKPVLVFFGWSDQHVQTNGDDSHIMPMVEAMNCLPGKAYPPQIGEVVEKPDFVLGCGDITEWPTHAAMRSYDRIITQELKFPAVDILGNHDEGGKVPSQTMKRWLIGRHGSLSHTFKKGEITFLCVFATYDENLDNPAQPITDEALGWIRAELAKVPDGKPVVVAMHLCYDAITNRDAVVDAFGDDNVILVLGGHYHQANVRHHRGVPFVQLPSPKSDRTDVSVIRIFRDRVEVLVRDYRAERWRLAPGVSLVE